MTSNAHAGSRVLSSLRSADGKGVVRVEDRLESAIDDVWSALTEPRQLARYGEVDGDLQPGGEYRFTLSPADRKAPGAWKRARRRSGCCCGRAWSSRT